MTAKKHFLEDACDSIVRAEQQEQTERVVAVQVICSKYQATSSIRRRVESRSSKFNGTSRSSNPKKTVIDEIPK